MRFFIYVSSANRKKSWREANFSLSGLTAIRAIDTDPSSPVIVILQVDTIYLPYGGSQDF